MNVSGLRPLPVRVEERVFGFAKKGRVSGSILGLAEPSTWILPSSPGLQPMGFLHRPKGFSFRYYIIVDNIVKPLRVAQSPGGLEEFQISCS